MKTKINYKRVVLWGHDRFYQSSARSVQPVDDFRASKHLNHHSTHKYSGRTDNLRLGIGNNFR